MLTTLQIEQKIWLKIDFFFRNMIKTNFKITKFNYIFIFKNYLTKLNKKLSFDNKSFSKNGVQKEGFCLFPYILLTDKICLDTCLIFLRS